MSDSAPPLDDIRFVLDEILDLAALATLPAFEHADPDLVHDALAEAGRFAAEVIAPLSRVGDREHSHRNNDGSVTTPTGFVSAYQRYVEAGWGAVPFPAEYGGGEFPWLVATAIGEMMASGDVAFSLCPTLTQGAIDLLIAHGSEQQKETYLTKTVTGEWTLYLRLFAVVTGGWLMAHQALVAGTKLFAGAGEQDFLRAKLLTAHFYRVQLLPQSLGLLSAATAGAGDLMALYADQF